MPNIRHSLLARTALVSGESNERFAALLAALDRQFALALKQFQKNPANLTITISKKSNPLNAST